MYTFVYIYAYTPAHHVASIVWDFFTRAYIYRTKNFVESSGCRTRALEPSACVRIHTHMNIFT